MRQVWHEAPTASLRSDGAPGRITRAHARVLSPTLAGPCARAVDDARAGAGSLRGVREIKDLISRDILAQLDIAGIGLPSATYDIVGLPPVRFAGPAAVSGDEGST